MTIKHILQRRLQLQLLSGASFQNVDAVVRHLVAVQAQDYLGALWAIGARMPGETESTIEKALVNRSIIRTWPMRGTLHFIAAEDVRWMLALLTPRIITRTATIYRQSGLDKKVFLRSKKILIKALEGGMQLTRSALYDRLEAANIKTTDQRGLHILGYLAQEGVLCFGSRLGKQQTFTLLDEWIPSSRILTKEESLQELAVRYFNSHGPATLADYTWWSGLSPTDAKLSLDMAKGNLIHERVDNTSFWMSDSLNLNQSGAPSAHLLPSYDEFTVGYKDRTQILDPKYATRAGHGIFNPVLLLNGRIMGTWTRVLKGENVSVLIKPFSKLTGVQSKAVNKCIGRYCEFIEKSSAS